jgi:hypothetical protein
MWKILALALAVSSPWALAQTGEETRPSDPAPIGPFHKTVQEAPERPPICTDNPTISRSSHAVGDGVTVLEFNYNYTSTRDGNDPAHTMPIVLHHGLTENFELRLETNSLTWQGNNRGLADVNLGFRYEFEPNWAVVGLISLPSGGPAFRSQNAVPFVSLNHDQPLGEDDAMLFNLGATFLPNGNTQGLATMVYSRTINEDLSWFVETALVGKDTRVDTGVQIYLNSEFVINLAVLRGLSSTGQDWGGTIGFGSRF